MPIIALGRKQKKSEGREKKKKKVPDQRSEGSKRRKFSIKDWKKAKKKGKFSIEDQKQTKEIYRKIFGNHDLKWSSLFDYQPKPWVPMTFSPRTKQKQKRKRPKHSEPKFPPKNTVPKKKSYWSMITHVIFDLIGNNLQNQVMAYLWFGIRMKHTLPNQQRLHQPPLLTLEKK